MNINNNMESIFKYLDMTYSDDVIDKIVAGVGKHDCKKAKTYYGA